MSQTPANDPSVEHIVIHLARKYAPRLIAQTGAVRPLPAIARELAKYHVLVLLAERSASNTHAETPQAVQECHDLYRRMYNLLVNVSFPSLTTVNSFFFHGRTTFIVVFEAEARLVVELLAGYVAPYIAARQGTRSVASIELQGLMDRVLNKLDLHNLTVDQYARVQEEGISLLKQMLKMYLHQLPLTPFDEPFFDDLIQVQPPTQTPKSLSRPPLNILPGQFTKPFDDNTLPILNGDDPDFIQRLWDAPKPREEAPPQSDAPAPSAPPSALPPSGDTGSQNPGRGANRPLPPPQTGNGLPLPPLPRPPRRDNESD